MFYPFLCGAFHHQEDDENDIFWRNSVSSPRKTRRRKDNKNPYSTRGLDQFSALLAELEQKRQQIYSKTGSGSIVRFVYNNSNDFVPVVVKLKGSKKEDKNKPPPPSPPPTNNKDEHVSEEEEEEVVSKLQPINPSFSRKIEKKNSFSWNNVKCTSQNWRRPCCCIPAAIILILMFLVFFGRSAAIMCTCIGWYLVPTISGEGSDQFRTSMKRKENATKLSGNKMVSGKILYSHNSNKFGGIRDKSPTQHDQRKS